MYHFCHNYSSKGIRPLIMKSNCSGSSLFGTTFLPTWTLNSSIRPTNATQWVSFKNTLVVFVWFPRIPLTTAHSSYMITSEYSWWWKYQINGIFYYVIVSEKFTSILTYFFHCMSFYFRLTVKLFADYLSMDNLCPLMADAFNNSVRGSSKPNAKRK